jgi:hypothetical protein
VRKPGTAARRIDFAAWGAFGATFTMAAAAVMRHGIYDLESLLAIAAWLATTYLVYLVAFPGTLRSASRASGRAPGTPALAPAPSEAAPAPTPVVPEPVAFAPGGNGLENDAWVRLVEEDVALIDELDRHRSGLDESGRAVADHMSSRLREVLERAEVEVIDDDASFDRLRHAPLNPQGAPEVGTPIAEVVSPGFAIGPRVLRRAQVRLHS